MTATSETPAAAPQPPLVQWLATKQKQAAYTLLGAALVLVVATVLLAVWLTRMTDKPWAPSLGYAVVVFGVLAAVAALGTGLFRLLQQPGGESTELLVARMLILTVGGLVGLGLFLAGLVLAWFWWDSVLAWLDTDGPGKANRWQAGVLLLVAFLGLGIMFVSLQLGRTQERSNLVLRRLLYGYNAALTALLLLAVLVFVNIMVSVSKVGSFRLRTPFDFTAAGQFSLSPRSENILRNLGKPVEIINVSGYPAGLDENVRGLLTSCRAITDRIKIQELSPNLDRQKAEELSAKYPELERGSLLVIYDAGGRDEKHQLVKSSEMFAAPDRFDPNPASSHKFTGEDALMSALDTMSEGRKKPVIYFTQDHQELDINDLSSQQPGQGGGSFKAQLEKRNREVKALKFAPLDPKVPDDASLVVIAGPTQPFTPPGVKALREYMNRDGKLLVLLTVVVEPNKTIAPTGLEDFLIEYGIQVPRERLVTFPNFPGITPNQAVAVMNRRLQENPLAAAFANVRFRFEKCRPLQIAQGPGMNRYQTQPLMPCVSASWGETDGATPASDIIDELRRNREALLKKEQQLQEKGPPPLAIIVSQGGMDPNDPHAAMKGPQPVKPRLAVFASSSIASNVNVSEDSGTLNFDLLTSTIDWLRGREGSLGIPPKVNTAFTIQPRETSEQIRMIFLPPLLVIVSVLGLATGVWIVRRR